MPRVLGESRVQELISTSKCLTLTKVFQKRSLSSLYSTLEQLKRRAHEQCICEIKHGSFTPLIFVVTGGTGKEADVVYKQLTSLLSA